MCTKTQGDYIEITDYKIDHLFVNQQNLDVLDCTFHVTNLLCHRYSLIVESGDLGSSRKNSICLVSRSLTLSSQGVYHLQSISALWTKGSACHYWRHTRTGYPIRVWANISIWGRTPVQRDNKTLYRDMFIVFS